MLTNTDTRDPTTNSYSYRYRDCDSYSNVDVYTHFDTDSYSDGYGNSDSYSAANSARLADPNANGNKRYPATKASANSAASPVVGGEHEGGTRCPWPGIALAKAAQRVGKISPTAPSDICALGA